MPLHNQFINWEEEYRGLVVKTIDDLKEECKTNSYEITKLKATLSTILYVVGPLGTIIISLLTALFIKWFKI